MLVNGEKIAYHCRGSVQLRVGCGFRFQNCGLLDSPVYAISMLSVLLVLRCIVKKIRMFANLGAQNVTATPYYLT